MDDETAEIELLQQNLNKTRQISQRMISILSDFDTRLVKLEKGIAPLYASTQALTRRGENIDVTLMRIDEVASRSEGIAAEEGIILRGPQTHQLEVYTDTLERLNASIAFSDGNETALDTARLVETGAKKLTQLFTKLVAEACANTPAPLPLSLSSAPPSPPALLPPNLLTTLTPLVAFLRTLPQPATHPSHAAAPGIFAALKDAQRGYADMRGAWDRRYLEVNARRILERAESMDDGVLVGREVGRWVEEVLNIVEDEFNLLQSLAPLSGGGQLNTTFAALVTPILSLFSSTLSSLTALIKRALHRHAFLALSTHSALARLQSRWDDAMAPATTTRRGGVNQASGAKDVGSSIGSELRDALHALRAVCLRSFPEMLADIKAAGVPSPTQDMGTGILDIVVSTVKYMETLPAVREAAAAALATLGDGNWRMGQGVTVNKPPGNKQGDTDENIVLEHFTYDIIQALVGSLNALARAHRRPALGSILLLNNIAFLRSGLFLSPQSPIRTILPQAALDALQSAFRTARAGYFDANFSALLQTLSDDAPREKTGLAAGISSNSKEKTAAKERFTRFFETLEEIKERHRYAQVLPDDDEARETVLDEIVKLVVPSFQRFTTKNLEKEFSKNPQKYIKMSPEDVEREIKGFYKDIPF